MTTSAPAETTALPALDYARGEFWCPVLKLRDGETLQELVERRKAMETAMEEACRGGS